MILKDKKNVSKKDIVKNIRSSVGTTHHNIQEISDNIIEIISYDLIKNKKVNIKNFGSFNIIYKNQRQGRNPKTKERYKISSRKVVSFKVSDFLKKKLNEF